jgi:hypothetical protein
MAASKFLLLLLAWVGVTANGYAAASLVTISGAGTATATSEDQPGVQNPFTIQDSILFSFHYDPQTPDLAPAMDYGRYQVTNLNGIMVVDGVQKAFGANGGSIIDIQVFPDFADYEWYLRGGILFADPAIGTADLRVSFRGSELGYLGEAYGDALIPPPLSPADQWAVVLQRGPGNTASVSGLDTMRLRVVSEPATLALFGLGLAGLGAVRRRRSTS